MPTLDDNGAVERNKPWRGTLSQGAPGLAINYIPHHAMGAAVASQQPSALLSSLPHPDKSPALKNHEVVGALSSNTDQ